MAELREQIMRFSLRTILVVSAIVPLVLSYFLSPYFRPEPKRHLRITSMPRDLGSGTKTILLTVTYGTFIYSFHDALPYGSLDYVVIGDGASNRRYFTDAVVGHVIFRPDQAATKEMELQFQAVQEFVREEVIKEPTISVESFLDSHGAPVIIVLEKDELPELDFPK